MDSQNYRSYMNMNQKLIKKIDVHAPKLSQLLKMHSRQSNLSVDLKKKMNTHNTHHNLIELLRS